MPTRKDCFFDVCLGVLIGLLLVAGLTMISCRVMDTMADWEDVRAAEF